MPKRDHQRGEYDRQHGACQLVHLGHFISPISDNAWWHENVNPAARFRDASAVFIESVRGRHARQIDAEGNRNPEIKVAG
jgi:hypothetical protein